MGESEYWVMRDEREGPGQDCDGASWHKGNLIKVFELPPHTAARFPRDLSLSVAVDITKLWTAQEGTRSRPERSDYQGLRQYLQDDGTADHRVG